MTHAETADHYRVIAEISSGDRTVPDVRCDIRLPKRSCGRIEVLCWPNQQQQEQLDGVWEVSLQAMLYYAGGTKKRGDIFIARGIIESTVGHERANVGEYETRIASSDLTVTEHWGEKSGDDQATGGEFWIAPSWLLAPISMKRLCPTDGLRIELVEALSCRTENGIDLRFADNQIFLENEDRSITVQLELVAQFKLARDVSDVPALLPSLDTLLLLASLAERKQIRCAGWSAWDKNQLQRFYRRDIAIDDDPTTTDRVDPLIKKYEFREFLERTYRCFGRLRHRELITLAINGLTSKSNAPLELQYMSLFSAMQSVVLFHKRTGELEQHFRSAYAAAQKSFGWQADDLWPVADKNSARSLYCIRNHIEHGEPIVESDINALAIAKIHLQWTTERAVLAILGWPLERSAVSSRSLGGRGPYKDWRAIRDAMKMGGNT